jgi:hypothetical protein
MKMKNFLRKTFLYAGRNVDIWAGRGKMHFWKTATCQSRSQPSKADLSNFGMNLNNLENLFLATDYFLEMAGIPPLIKRNLL